MEAGTKVASTSTAGAGLDMSPGPLHEAVEQLRRSTCQSAVNSNGLEQRLVAAAEEQRALKKQIQKRASDLGQVSPALRQALKTLESQPLAPGGPPSADATNATSGEEQLLRQRLAQAEAARQRLTAEVDSLRSKLAEDEKGRMLLRQQLEEARLAVTQLERTRDSLRVAAEEARMETENRERRRKRSGK